MRRRGVGRLSLLAAALAAAGALSGCSTTGRDTLPEVSLPSLGSGAKTSLTSCPTAKCLTVYVAPWCPYCRAATPMIVALKEYLKDRGVTTRVVVGMSGPSEVAAYAKVFGAETLLDPRGAFPVSGVPHFVVSDARGAVLREVAGYPQDAKDAAELAADFGLP